MNSSVDVEQAVESIKQRRQNEYDSGAKERDDWEMETIYDNLEKSFVIRVTDLKSPFGFTKQMFAARDADDGEFYGDEINFYCHNYQNVPDVNEQSCVSILVTDAFRDGCLFKQYKLFITFHEYNDYGAHECGPSEIIELLRKLAHSDV